MGDDNFDECYWDDDHYSESDEQPEPKININQACEDAGHKMSDF